MKFAKKAVVFAIALLMLATNFAATKVSATDYIKWAEINCSENALSSCINSAINFNSKGIVFTLSKALTFLSLKNGNKFSDVKDNKSLNEYEKRIAGGETEDAILPQGKYTNYYLGVYDAVFKNYVGKYKAEDGAEKFGLRCYFPFAASYWYNHYDDFGNSRSYGYKRRHLGHDMMGSVGTPIVATECGTVSECGWNRFGGWRIGIRTHDSLRYYYYAHLRKDRPFAAGLKVGDSVVAGQVIGYLGNTGYSSKENTNLKTGKPHLHFGLQLIFDKSQEKGNKEIWVDVYAIAAVLSRLRAKVLRDDSKEAISQNIRQWID